ncbi:MAG TPA: hypothetical protein VMT58_09590, partial [Candidatus Binataceae bacterium]|nr:hypothetical protein [Candidatus Binataceae bacterium]
MTLTAAAIAVIWSIAPAAFAQNILQPGRGYYRYGQWSAGDMKAARANAAAATTVPMWGYTIKATRDNNNYSGVMVGRSPFFHGARTTNIPAIIIPIKVNMPDGGVFDPGATNGCIPGKNPLNLMQNSPIVQTTDFNFGGTDIGTAQYIDAFQRASFISEISATGDRYHTVLSPVTTLSTVTINVPNGDGATFPANENGFCADFGLIKTTYWDNFAGGGEVGSLITSLSGQGVNPKVLPIFFFTNV